MFEEEYVRSVIGPKLLPICAKATSITEVCAEFANQWGFTLNRSRALRWLGILGVTPRKQTLFVGLAAAENPTSPAEGFDIDLGPGPEVKDASVDVPGQMRFSFPNIAPPAGMFANVPMPGFN